MRPAPRTRTLARPPEEDRRLDARWSYKVVPLRGVELAERTLSDLGRDGWELVAVVPDATGSLAYLKRRLTSIPRTTR